MVTFADQRGLAQALGAAEDVLKLRALGALQGRDGPVPAPDGGALVMDADTRARLRSMSERDGRVVTEAGNGRDALDLFLLAEPSVVLLDLSMPVMNGFDGLASLRARPDGAHVPVMMLTVRDLDREDRRSLSGDSQILNRGT